MKSKLFIGLYAFSLLIASNSEAKNANSQTKHEIEKTSENSPLVSSNSKKTKASIPKEVSNHRTKENGKEKSIKNKPSQIKSLRVPAIGANSKNANITLPSPDSTVTEPIAIERRTAPPPPANLMSGKNAILTTRENAGMAIAKNYNNNRVMPTRGAEGVVVFPFGETMPSIVCAPLIVCDITLQEGEVVNDINVGDAVRWKLSPATSGSGMSTTTHVIVKPTDAALQTNAIITTDKRTYVLKLVSRRTDYMARISFTYADDMDTQWRDYHSRINVNSYTATTNQSTLNFNYSIKGAKPKWRPIRVYNDNLKTYIEFPDAIKTSEAPALLVLDEGKQEQLVNYRVLGTRYVVDKIFDNAELISGTGSSQTKVTISRKD